MVFFSNQSNGPATQHPTRARYVSFGYAWIEGVWTYVGSDKEILVDRQNRLRCCSLVGED